ncbi:DUF2332 family protein [Achromobacter sp. UMC71]|uniref:DUF2332 family protein n=1 Tax=Achromobacter sp. UMC71 TaxID=1862320 RepID=UPI001C806C4B
MDRITDRYLRVAKIEAAGRSPLYEQWALHVAKSSNALAFLNDLPVDKQQPNLLFTALRHTVGAPSHRLQITTQAWHNMAPPSGLLCWLVPHRPRAWALCGVDARSRFNRWQDNANRSGGLCRAVPADGEIRLRLGFTTSGSLSQ